MKDSKRSRRTTWGSNGVSRPLITKSNYSHNITGMKPVKRSNKGSDHEILLRRLQENFQYFQLRLVIPPRSTWEKRSHGNYTGLATGAEVPGEIPAKKEEETMKNDDEKQKEVQKGIDNISVVLESSEEPFIPSITIRKMDAASLFIHAVVLKDVARPSILFRVLEEEEEEKGITIVSENHHRTDQNRVAYTIQVKAQADYNLDVLEKKLCAWAGKNEHLRLQDSFQNYRSY